MTSARAEITDDSPLRLADAVALAFPMGGMTVAGLRTEARAGRLAIERIAGKDYVTLRAIREMRDRCRRIPKEPGYGSNQPAPTVANAPSGSSETAPDPVALDAALTILEGLKKPCVNTSPGNTTRPAVAAVIPLSHVSRMSSASTAKRSPAATPGPRKRHGVSATS